MQKPTIRAASHTSVAGGVGRSCPHWTLQACPQSACISTQHKKCLAETEDFIGKVCLLPHSKPDSQGCRYDWAALQPLVIAQLDNVLNEYESEGAVRPALQGDKDQVCELSIDVTSVPATCCCCTVMNMPQCGYTAYRCRCTVLPGHICEVQHAV